MLDKKLIELGVGRDFESWYSDDEDDLSNKLSTEDYVAPKALFIKTDSYVGNFDRELVAYCLGILDSVQMKIDFCPEIIAEFDKEVDTSKYDSVELRDKYLYEYYTDVDDWSQVTFYQMDSKSRYNSLVIYFTEDVPDDWIELIKERAEKFFSKHEGKVKLLGFELLEKVKCE